MFGRNHSQNWSGVEARIVRAIDQFEAIMDAMSDEEIIAFGILYGGKKPEGRFTREWACQVVSGIARAKLTGMLAAWCMRTEDLNDVDRYLRFFVPEAPRQDKVTVGGEKDAPIGVNHTHTVMTAGEFVGKLIEDVGVGFSRGLPDPAEKLGQPGVAAPEPLLDPGQGEPGH